MMGKACLRLSEPHPSLLEWIIDLESVEESGFPYWKGQAEHVEALLAGYFPFSLHCALPGLWLTNAYGDFAKVASSDFFIWFWFVFPPGLTSDFSSAHVPDEWPDSRGQGKEYSFRISFKSAIGARRPLLSM